MTYISVPSDLAPCVMIPVIFLMCGSSTCSHCLVSLYCGGDMTEASQSSLNLVLLGCKYRPWPATRWWFLVCSDVPDEVAKVPSTSWRPWSWPWYDGPRSLRSRCLKAPNSLRRIGTFQIPSQGSARPSTGWCNPYHQAHNRRTPFELLACCTTEWGGALWSVQSQEGRECSSSSRRLSGFRRTPGHSSWDQTGSELLAFDGREHTHLPQVHAVTLIEDPPPAVCTVGDKVLCDELGLEHFPGSLCGHLADHHRPLEIHLSRLKNIMMKNRHTLYLSHYASKLQAHTPVYNY